MWGAVPLLKLHLCYVNANATTALYLIAFCRSRGFGFVAFDRSTCVDQLQNERPHHLDGKEVDTKRVVPKVSIVPTNAWMILYHLAHSAQFLFII